MKTMKNRKRIASIVIGLAIIASFVYAPAVTNAEDGLSMEVGDDTIPAEAEEAGEDTEPSDQSDDNVTVSVGEDNESESGEDEEKSEEGETPTSPTGEDLTGSNGAENKPADDGAGKAEANNGDTEEGSDQQEDTNEPKQEAEGSACEGEDKDEEDIEETEDIEEEETEVVLKKSPGSLMRALAQMLQLPYNTVGAVRVGNSPLAVGKTNYAIDKTEIVFEPSDKSAEYNNVKLTFLHNNSRKSIDLCDNQANAKSFSGTLSGAGDYCLESITYQYTDITAATSSVTVDLLNTSLFILKPEDADIQSATLQAHDAGKGKVIDGKDLLSLQDEAWYSFEKNGDLIISFDAQSCCRDLMYKIEHKNGTSSTFSYVSRKGGLSNAFQFHFELTIPSNEIMKEDIGEGKGIAFQLIPVYYNGGTLLGEGTNKRDIFLNIDNSEPEASYFVKDLSGKETALSYLPDGNEYHTQSGSIVAAVSIKEENLAWGWTDPSLILNDTSVLLSDEDLLDQNKKMIGKKYYFTISDSCPGADENGISYQIQLRDLKDKADNQVEESCKDYLFIIDKKDPEAAMFLHHNGNSSYHHDGMEVYDGPVSLAFEVNERWPAFEKTEVTVTKDGGVYPSPVLDFKKKENDLYRSDNGHTLNEDGYYTVTYKAFDKSGRASEEITKSFIIAAERPTISIEYDEVPPVNGIYYSQARCATITVNSVLFGTNASAPVVEQRYGQAKFEGWTKADTGSHVYTGRIVFDQDGYYKWSYDFSDVFQRTAKAEGGEFYIDRTAPVISVEYDNHAVKNGMYYGGKRTAIITVEDITFLPEKVYVTEMAGEDVSGVPFSGGFINVDGTTKYRTEISFDADGKYGFSVYAVDAVGLRSNVLASGLFVIDTTAPQISFGGVENYSANNGVVAPVINYNDLHVDANTAEITLTGANRGSVNLANNRAETETGYQISYTDYPHTKEMDDLYTLSVSIEDYAGNRSEESMVFSVNRFGSVYVIGDETRKMINDVYTNDPQKVSITEINVDELTYKRVSLSRDGDLRVLQQNMDYQVYEQEANVSWHSYTYVLSEDVFNADGAYSVSVLSEDRATNVQDNRTRNAQIDFIVDRTPPGLVVSGISDEGIYEGDSREIALSVTDNTLVESVQVYVNETIIHEIEREELDQDGERMEISLPAADDYQDIRIVADDVAGNVAETEYRHIWIGDQAPVIEEVEIAENPVPLSSVPDNKGVVLQDYHEDTGSIYVWYWVLLGTVLAACIVLAVFFVSKRKNEQR